MSFNSIETPLSVEVEIKIPFHDVDSMQIVWHGNYIKYFEIARTELGNMLNYNMDQMGEAGIMWPVIDCRCRYIQALKYGDVIVVKATIAEIVHRFKVNYLINEKSTGKKIAKGSTTQAAVNIATNRLTETTVLENLVEKFLQENRK
ncbi:MAG: acyl-CoA thioesterase [Proteobacteria bacterium]|nr:acyl-CoA thioesterase [Pseudomonadota bacterium]